MHVDLHKQAVQLCTALDRALNDKVTTYFLSILRAEIGKLHIVLFFLIVFRRWPHGR